MTGPRDELEPWAVGEEVVDTHEAARILGLAVATVNGRAEDGVLKVCGRRFRGDGGGKGRPRNLYLLADIENELDYMRRRGEAS